MANDNIAPRSEAKQYEHVKIHGTSLDRRRKLTPEMAEDIKDRYSGGESIRSIARSYQGQYSRRAITFLLDPQKLKDQKEYARANRCNFPSNSRQKRRLYMQRHRDYKRQIFIDGHGRDVAEARPQRRNSRANTAE